MNNGNTTINNALVEVKPLPKNAAQMLAQRLTVRGANLTDCVEHALLEFVNDKLLSERLEATIDAESVTGKVKLDNVLAAERLMDLSKDHPVISKEKLVVVQRAMNVVLRRYGMAGDQRRAALAAPLASNPAGTPAASAAHNCFSIAAE